MQRTFGRFQFNLATGDLRRDGARIPLQPVLEKLLVELISRAGEPVSRADLARSLWPDGTHVDYENSLNNAIARLRLVIGARWIETVPRRGYRFAASKVRPTRRPHPDAERARLRGEHFWNRTTAAGLRRSAACFDQAAQTDPDNAPALAGLAHAHILLGDQIIEGSHPRVALGQAQRAAERALAADPDCPQALSALGLVAWRERWDWDAAERYFRAAVAIDSKYARGHLYYGWMLQAQRRTRESLGRLRRAHQLDPLSPFVGTNVAWMLYTSRRYSDALEVLSDVLDLEPHYAMAHLARGLCLQQAAGPRAAIPALTTASTLAGEASYYYRAALAQAQAAAGHPAPDCGGSSLDRAMLHLGRQEFGPALDCLERAVQESSSHVSYLLVDPLFDPLRGERRFKRLACSLGLWGR